MKRTLVLLAVAGLAALAAAVQAQTSLKLPQSSRDYLELLRNSESDECPGCGVVTSVRAVAGGPPPAPGTPPPGLPPTGTGLGSEGTPSTPLFARETREYHESVRQGRPSHYVITVRFFDGSYGEYKQLDQPVVQRGDRVRVTEDRAEPRR
jgi:hypothetical protein